MVARRGNWECCACHRDIEYRPTYMCLLLPGGKPAPVADEYEAIVEAHEGIWGPLCNDCGKTRNDEYMDYALDKQRTKWRPALPGEE